ncbi:hypothetical protein B0H11DRAFT_2028561 [Mycena galericulata]|nr:hypothetical protein B0H11DRAFT_2028561 [Mycena galericulata]
MCDFLDFGYERPDTKRKVTSQKSTSTTGGATFGLTGLVPSLTVTGGYTRGGGENVEVADEKPMPRCNIDYDLGKRWDPEEARKVKKDFHSYDVSWLPAMNRQKVAHEMRVEFGLGMRIRQKKLLYGPGLPQISSILRNQIVIWVHDPDLRSKSRGVLLLTSTYIPDVRTDKRLTIHETTTANLDVQWSQDPPVAEPVEVPYNAATWVSVAALNKSKKKISSTVGKFFDKLSFKSSAAAGKSSTAELPIYETVSRGWDTTNKRWKNVLWPTLDQDFRRVNNKQEGAAWKLVWSTNTGPPAPAPPALPIPTVTVSQPLIIPHKDEPRVSSASTTTADIAFTSIFDPDEAATAYTSLASSSRTDIKNSAPAP